MGVTQQQLKQLQEPIAFKYRLQSAKSGRATIVSYIDSRAVAQRLDDVLGAENWQDDYKVVNGNLLGGIGVLVEDFSGHGNYWNWKWDVGTESNVDAEKGELSDSFKRAAVKLGIGRFLYQLGIITLKTATHTNGKEYPATDEGKILWSVDELTEYCKKVADSGELDRTKFGVKPLGGKATANPTPVNKVTPTATAKTTTTKKDDSKPVTSNTVQAKDVKAPSTQTGGAIQPNENFDKKDDSKPSEDESRRAKAIELFSKLPEADILKLTIKSGFKYTTSKEFLAKEPIDKILEIYTKLTTK